MSDPEFERLFQRIADRSNPRTQEPPAPRLHNGKVWFRTCTPTTTLRFVEFAKRLRCLANFCSVAVSRKN